MKKCQLCKRRNAKAGMIYLEWLGKAIALCEKCRREEVPTKAEQDHEDTRETYRAEMQAELDSRYVNLDY